MAHNPGEPKSTHEAGTYYKIDNRRWTCAEIRRMLPGLFGLPMVP